MREADRDRRFRVDSLAVDATGSLDPGPAVRRHLKVVRAVRGDTIVLFDGAGAEVRAEIVAIDADAARLRVIETLNRAVESRLDLCLVQAIPARLARMETIVRQVTELGVARLVPVLSSRGQHAATAPHKKAARWRRIADSAAEQSGRTRVPTIDDPCRFTDLAWAALPPPLLITDPRAARGLGTADVAVPRGLDNAARSLGNADAAIPRSLDNAARGLGDADTAVPCGLDNAARSLGNADAAVTASLTLMVGPEGGWDAAELDTALQHGATGVSLGPRILRADTAGAVAVTLAQFLWGDLGVR